MGSMSKFLPFLKYVLKYHHTTLHSPNSLRHTTMLATNSHVDKLSPRPSTHLCKLYCHVINIIPRCASVIPPQKAVLQITSHLKQRGWSELQVESTAKMHSVVLTHNYSVPHKTYFGITSTYYLSDVMETGSSGTITQSILRSSNHLSSKEEHAESWNTNPSFPGFCKIEAPNP